MPFLTTNNFELKSITNIGVKWFTSSKYVYDIFKQTNKLIQTKWVLLTLHNSSNVILIESLWQCIVCMDWSLGMNVSKHLSFQTMQLLEIPKEARMNKYCYISYTWLSIDLCCYHTADYYCVSLPAMIIIYPCKVNWKKKRNW